jgi:hypothetical protein
MSGQTPSAYRRLILELYHGAADAATMRSAAEFARLLDLDLHCLFIEDEALFALAELPFAREIRLPTHQWSPIDADTMAAELRQAAAETRRALDEIIRSVGVASAFEVLRGDPAACIAAVCQAGDIVVVAQPGPPIARTTHGIAQAQAAAHGSAAAVLLLPARFQPRRGPVVAVLADAVDASLDVACRIATAAGEGLALLLPETLAESGERAGVDAARQRAWTLGLRPERITVHRVRGAQAEDVLHALAGLRESLIVMTRAAFAAGDAAGASRIAAARGAPVLLIEGEPHTGQPPGG